MTPKDITLKNSLGGISEGEKSRIAAQSEYSTTLRIVLCVLLPLSTGYFLSYYYRTVNAVLSQRLMSDLDLTATQLGLMTAAYFLMAACAQLPFGWALDRYGPRQVQSRCLIVAAIGAALFSISDQFSVLFLARALIGIGVASALLAGMKALVMSSPKDQLGLFNGIYMSIGAAGAIAASLPTEQLLHVIDWRRLFHFASVATLASAALIAFFVPRGLVTSTDAATSGPPYGYRQIFSDRSFWQIAPLSATTIGSAWALQGLWSAPWLRDVAHLDQQTIAHDLLYMAIALSLGAFCLGYLIHRLGKHGIEPAQIMAGAVFFYIVAELCLAFALPVPPIIPWSIVSAFAAGTVLTYTISAQRFQKESVGRANSAFNLLHFAAAFGVQTVFGHVISFWPKDAAGHYPTEAYRTAFLALVSLQVVALVWFLRPNKDSSVGNARPAYARFELTMASNAMNAVIAVVVFAVLVSQSVNGLTAK